MYGVNKVILIGTVGRDPDVTNFDNGGKVAQTSIATTKKGYTRQNGTKVEDSTEWHNIVFHDRLAEVAEKYIRKGTNIYTEGELRTRKYTRNNQECRVTEVHVTDMHLIPSGNRPAQTQPVQPQPEQQPVQNAPQTQPADEQDLPF